MNAPTFPNMSVSHQLPEDVFLFGASCAPYAKGLDWPMEEWDNDLATMRSLNFNTVRMFAAWDRIEQEEGIFDFSKQDYLFDLAAKHGIRVILNFGGLFGQLCGLYIPQYLVREGTVQPILESPHSAPDYSQPCTNACMDDPEYREKAFAFMERTVRRYASRDNLLAWMIWNEPAAPFCYCRHTQANFRMWLKEKYVTVDHVNEAWGTECPIRYTSWDEITAPKHAGIVSMWYDWVRFNHSRLYRSLEAITEMTRRCDPQQRPTTSNLVFHMAALEGSLSTPRYGLDVGRIGKSMTLMGVSCYTVEHLHDLGPGYLVSYKLSRLRSASQDEHRRMFVLETGVGPNKRMITKDQRILAFWHLIAHNAKSIILWNYRSRISDAQVGLFHLMHWDGSVSRRAEYMGEFSKLLQTHAQLLNKVYPEREAAILALEDQQIQMEALCGDYFPATYPEIHDSRIGAYKMLWDMQIPTDCIAENNLGELSRYKLLLLPMAEHLTHEVAAMIRQFVSDGGTVIAESPFAFRDQDGRLQYRAPGFGLEEVFGCWTNDREGKETAPPIRCPEGDSKAYFFWSEYELSGGEALAHYDGIGSAAAVRNHYGKGTALIVGTEVFRQYLNDEQPAMTRLLQSVIIDSGAQPTAWISGDSQDIEVARLSGSGGVLQTIINHSDAVRSVRLTFREAGGSWRNLQTGKIANLSEDITLDAKQVVALKWEAA